MVWQRLTEQPGYRLLCDLYIDKTKTLPIVNGEDSKEQFYFDAIRKDMAVEVLMRPIRDIGDIELAE